MRRSGGAGKRPGRAYVRGAGILEPPLNQGPRPEEGKFSYPVQEGKMPAAAMDITAMSIEPDAVRNNIK